MTVDSHRGSEEGGDADDAPTPKRAAGSTDDGGDEEQAAAYRRVLELERKNERLEALLEALGHDLRNHLAVAEGRLSLAGIDDDEDLQAVAQSHERMGELLDDLLDPGLEGFVVGDPEPVSLATQARAAWAPLETDGAALVVASDPVVSADPDRLRQLLENLFRNSLKHGGEGGDLTVTVGSTAEGSGFYVEDDGRGLPTTRPERLFEPGFSTATDGTGLGLSIVRDVVVGHGWTVQATEAADGGARFEFAGIERPTRPAAERAAE